MSLPDRAPVSFDDHIEAALGKIHELLKGRYLLSKRSIGLFLLQEDEEIKEKVRSQEKDGWQRIEEVIDHTKSEYGQPLRQVISMQRQELARKIASAATQGQVQSRSGLAETLSRFVINPVTGIPVLLVFLYVGLYQFVGVFGAGIGVDFLESQVFGEWINPWLVEWVRSLIPWTTISDLFVGEYGIITLGLTYAVAIVLPIVGTFFVVFSIIEDSGYLPRLSLLIDRVFKFIGLSGRAVIPMVLGFGCVTMATVVTRTQESRRERILTTLLLALAIPCSAQLGVIFAILSENTLSLVLWMSVMILTLLVVGFLASKVVPGRKTAFYMEIPPLRLPKPSNVAAKTITRLQWYLAEVIPIFVIASVLLWLADLTGIFKWILLLLEPLVQAIGLPPESAVAFLFGFFRRDFGAAGLYDLHADGLLVGSQLLVAAVTLTLFVPCVAQFVVMWKERGAKVALAIASFIFPFAFFVGFLLNTTLEFLGVSL